MSYFLKIVILVVIFFTSFIFAAPKHDINADLGSAFGFGVSVFSSADNGDWITKEHTDYGVEWQCGYYYISQIDNPISSGGKWLMNFRMNQITNAYAIPVVTFYRFLNIGEDHGFTGTEMEIVQDCMQNASCMNEYFDNVIDILQIMSNRNANSGEIAIFHSEPDSWGFMMWAMGVEGNDDATSVPASVGSCGHTDVSGFPNHAGGIGQALLHLRDKYSPQTRMGWHASNFRVGKSPEVVTDFYSSMGDWDVIFTEPPHMRSSGTEWWESWDETTCVPDNLNWLSTISDGVNLPFLVWQAFLGDDYHFIGNWPDDKNNLSRIAEAGVAGYMFHHAKNSSWGDPTDADLHTGYQNQPSGGTPGGTAGDYRSRLLTYNNDPYIPEPVLFINCCCLFFIYLITIQKNNTFFSHA